MGVLDLFRGKLLDPAADRGVHAGGDVITTTVDAVVKWGRKSSIWPIPPSTVFGSGPGPRTRSGS